MSGLLGPKGEPIDQWKTVHNKKVAPPPTGEKYGTWGGPDVHIFQMPGGGAIQFDLNQLDLSDYRQMRDHYQISSSLSVLMFLLHQLEWRIVVDDKKQRDFYTEQIENIWTPLVRSKSQAFWAGHSPNVLQWENNVPDRRVELTKIKDLMPEYSDIHWKTVDGAGTNKISVYDGIRNFGQSKPIPVDNCVTAETPILMSDFSWKKAGDIEAGEVVLAFDENERIKGRRYKMSLVEANRLVNAECVTIESRSGEPITVSKAHPFLVRRGPLLTGDKTTSIYKDRWEWVKAVDLKIGDKIGFFGNPSQRDESREAGYVAGIFDGEGHFVTQGGSVTLGFSQRPGAVLDETLRILDAKGFDVSVQKNTRDDCQEIRILGGRREIARFMEVFSPERLRQKTAEMFDDTVMRIERSVGVTQVTAIFDAGVQQVANLQTETSTYISSGYLSHNSYWYPLLMENGDMRGRKLLRSAFQPWFFSILMHLFANRYYERFGEPTPIGRAPYDDDIRMGGVEMKGNQAMEHILGSLRNRSVVVLPNEKTPFGDETTLDYDYQIEYLESQMRGADFERYMTRLDEEMSLALFTPILTMRTADVGSYNLGTQHMQTYKLLLNAIAGDWKFYIDWYILRPMRNFNFGTNADMPRISFRRMGADNEEMIRDIVRALFAKGAIKTPIEELGEMAGLPLQEVQQLTDPGTDQPGDPTQPSQSPDSSGSAGGSDTENALTVAGVVGSIRDRLDEQVRNAFRKNKLRDATFDLGFQSKFEAALKESGVPHPLEKTRDFYDSMIALLDDMKVLDYSSADSFLLAFMSNAEWKYQQLLKDGN